MEAAEGWRAPDAIENQAEKHNAFGVLSRADSAKECLCHLYNYNYWTKRW